MLPTSEKVEVGHLVKGADCHLPRSRLPLLVHAHLVRHTPEICQAARSRAPLAAFPCTPCLGGAAPPRPAPPSPSGVRIFTNPASCRLLLHFGSPLKWVTLQLLLSKAWASECSQVYRY